MRSFRLCHIMLVNLCLHSAKSIRSILKYAKVVIKSFIIIIIIIIIIIL